MKSIKTSKKVKHYCRLFLSDALTYRCKNQCKTCKENESNNREHRKNY